MEKRRILIELEVDTIFSIDETNSFINRMIEFYIRHNFYKCKVKYIRNEPREQ